MRHSAQEAVDGAILPLQGRRILIHTVLEDVGFEVHAIGKSEHPTGSCVSLILILEARSRIRT